MKHGFVKVAAVTPKIKVADPAYNTEVICDTLKAAYEKKAKLIVFPELCITGYTCNDLFLQELLLEQAEDALFAVAEQTKGQDALVFVGLPMEKDGKLYNVAAVLQNGKILGAFHQRMHF
ncbi:MAG: nitrilase-related carbon-nitrogen hydrolase [Lachnospiraceae bacterium]